MEKIEEKNGIEFTGIVWSATIALVSDEAYRFLVALRELRAIGEKGESNE